MLEDNLRGDEELVARLEEALRRQDGRLEETLSDPEVVETALKEVIRQGYRSHVALVHVIFQARKIFGDDWGLERTTDIPRWRDPKWVGQIRLVSLSQARWGETAGTGGPTTSPRRRQVGRCP